jgi:hypothetical protein
VGIVRVERGDLIHLQIDPDAVPRLIIQGPDNPRLIERQTLPRFSITQTLLRFTSPKSQVFAMPLFQYS